jgi:hypothetical protein
MSFWTHSERGKLLFRLREPKPASRYKGRLGALVALVLVAAADSLGSYYSGRRTHWELFAGLLFGLVIGVVYRFVTGWNVAFYENGVFFPADPAAKNGSRFLPWGQVVRYYSEGDVLTIMPGTSLLAGAGSLGQPTTGGSVSIPPARRADVDKLLSAFTTIATAS